MPRREMAEDLGAPQLSDKDRPYVTFITKTEEDIKESRAQGKMVWRDVHYARVTPMGSKDINFHKLPQWWEQVEQYVNQGRYAEHWLDQWKRAFEAHEKGLALPVDGMPIRGWGLIPGAMQEAIVQANILTVETLATANSEALARIGMGAVEMQRRAQAWVEQHKDKEGLAVKMAAVQQENDGLKEQIEGLIKKVEDLSKKVERKAKEA